MFLGKFNNNVCKISNSAPNKSVCLTGISGSGKSTRMHMMEIMAAKDNQVVIVLDMHHSHAVKNIYGPLLGDFLKYENRILVKDVGLNIPLLSPIMLSDTRADYVYKLNQLVRTVSSSSSLGPRQTAALKSAVKRAIDFKSQCTSSDCKLIEMALETAEDTFSQGVYDKLETFLGSDLVRDGSAQFERGRINVVDLNGLDEITQLVISEVFLSHLWQTIQGENNASERTSLFIDEFQHLSIKHDSTLASLLREGRKYGLGLVLATQTLSSFPKQAIPLINQVATHMFFKPSLDDLRRTSKQISVLSGENLSEALASLKVGESIALGNIEINKRDITRPLLLK